MSNPKEKAKELVEKYLNVKKGMLLGHAKTMAYIAIEEVLNGEQAAYSFPVEMGQFFINYWKEVKKEIELL